MYNVNSDASHIQSAVYIYIYIYKCICSRKMWTIDFDHNAVGDDISRPLTTSSKYFDGVLACRALFGEGDGDLFLHGEDGPGAIKLIDDLLRW